jgi:putative DNA primase/helicase
MTPKKKGRWQATPQENTQANYSDFDKAREALRFIPTGDHDHRFRIGASLKSGLGDAGRELWDEWRSGRGDDEANSTWRSIRTDGGITLATLFYEARRNGY